LRLSNFEDATEFCDRALFLDPRNVKALFRRSLAHKACKRYDSAINDLTTALSIEPSNEDLRKELRMNEVGGAVLAGMSPCRPLSLVVSHGADWISPR
jgi:tetratricopeptide (TPR) repeat protein